MEWQPIDTAPKDGTWILGLNNRGNCAVIIWVDRPEAGVANRDWGTGWIHPFSDMTLSSFWNGACGSVPIAWAALPKGEELRRLLEKFSPRG